jgi:phosphate starvation-inducible PhoH-like protein
MVVTGDITQIDLPAGKSSGLIHASEVLRGQEGMSFIVFEEVDVVRHNLVQRIVRAYERYNQQFGSARQLTLKLGQDGPQETAARGEGVPPDAVETSVD